MKVQDRTHFEPFVLEAYEKQVLAERKGLFVVLEGINGSGKTTLHRAVFDELRKHMDLVNLLGTVEPTYGPAGSMIRKSGSTLTPIELLQLFVEDRMWNTNSLKRSFANGKVILQDRYYLSTVAYQGQAFDFEALFYIQRCLFPPPDVCFVINVDPQVALDRMKASRGNLSSQEEDDIQTLDELNLLADLYLRMPAMGDYSNTGERSCVPWIKTIESEDLRSMTDFVVKEILSLMKAKSLPHY